MTNPMDNPKKRNSISENRHLNIPKNTSLPVLTKIYHSSLLQKESFKGFGVYHNRILVSAIVYFQKYIQGQIFEQLQLNFNEVDNDVLKIPIFLDEISPSRENYNEVYQCAIELMQINSQFTERIGDIDYDSTISPFQKVSTPAKTINNKNQFEKLGKKAVIYVSVNKEFFKKICDVSFGYIPYFKEVVMSSGNKYLPKLYWELSQFQKNKNSAKGGFRKIAFFDLLDILGIDTQKNKTYKVPRFFNQKILDPILKELYKKSQFFARYSLHKYKDKPTEYYYNFTIINNEEMKNIDKTFLHISKSLAELFPNSAMLIEELLREQDTYLNAELLLTIHLQLSSLKNTNKADSIDNPVEFIKSIIKKYKDSNPI